MTDRSTDERALLGASTVAHSTEVGRAAFGVTLGSSDTVAAAGEDPGASASLVLARGTRIGRYQLAEPLGSGGMGVVYRAYDPELGRWVAIKVLRADRRDARDLGRFLREAQAMARLSHPNVVPVHDVGAYEGGMFLAMELVEGDTLRSWFTLGPHPWRTCVELLLQAARGLAEAHAAGLIHRDFKPENVLVDRRGRARVTDFGLARPEGAGAPSGSLLIGGSRLTRSGTILGTPAYMAPEQLMGRTVDARADVFAFCATLFEALHGHTPFAGRTFAERLEAIETGAIRLPDRRLPRWLGRLLAGGLAARPDGRPDMTALIAALERGLARRRAAWVVAGAAGLVAGAAGLGLARGEPPRCAGAEEALVGVWDQAAREAVAAGIRRTGRPFAEDTWSKVETILDADAGAWAALRRSSCEAHERGEISDALLDRRAVCLAQRRADLLLLTAALQGADGETVERAIDAARSLDPAQSCEDPEAVPPATPERLIWLEGQRGRLAQVRLLEVTHKHEEGLRLVGEALAEIEARGEEDLRVEGLLLRARLEYDRGAYDAARRDALAALEGAHARGRDRQATQAAAHLVLLDGEVRGRFEVGEAWARLALAGARRIGDPIEEATVRHFYGAMLSSADRSDEALAELQQAYELRQRLRGRDHRETASTAMTLGNALWKRGRTDEALRYHEAAAADQEAALGPQHPGLIAPLANLGVSQEALGRVDEARRSWERSLALIVANYGDSHPNAGALHANLGSLALATGALDEAREHLASAVQISRERLGSEHADFALILANYANVLTERGEHDAADAALREALAIVTKVQGDGHSNHAAIAELLARLCRKRGRVDEARELLRGALQTTERALGPEHPRVAGVLLALADPALAQPSAALAELERARTIAARGAGSELLRARVDLALSRTLSALGRDPGRAAELLAAAQQVADASGLAGAELRAELAARRRP